MKQALLLPEGSQDTYENCLRKGIHLVRITGKPQLVQSLESKDTINIVVIDELFGFRLKHPEEEDFHSLSLSLGYMAQTIYEVSHGAFTGDLYACIAYAVNRCKENKKVVVIANVKTKRAKMIYVPCSYYGARPLYSFDDKFKKYKKAYLLKYQEIQQQCQTTQTIQQIQ